MQYDTNNNEQSQHENINVNSSNKKPSKQSKKKNKLISVQLGGNNHQQITYNHPKNYISEKEKIEQNLTSDLEQSQKGKRKRGPRNHNSKAKFNDPIQPRQMGQLSHQDQTDYLENPQNSQPPQIKDLILTPLEKLLKEFSDRQSQDIIESVFISFDKDLKQAWNYLEDISKPEINHFQGNQNNGDHLNQETDIDDKLDFPDMNSSQNDEDIQLKKIKSKVSQASQQSQDSKGMGGLKNYEGDNYYGFFEDKTENDSEIAFQLHQQLNDYVGEQIDQETVKNILNTLKKEEDQEDENRLFQIQETQYEEAQKVNDLISIQQFIEERQKMKVQEDQEWNKGVNTHSLDQFPTLAGGGMKLKPQQQALASPSKLPQEQHFLPLDDAAQEEENLRLALELSKQECGGGYDQYSYDNVMKNSQVQPQGNSNSQRIVQELINNDVNYLRNGIISEPRVQTEITVVKKTGKKGKGKYQKKKLKQPEPMQITNIIETPQIENGGALGSNIIDNLQEKTNQKKLLDFHETKKFEIGRAQKGGFIDITVQNKRGWGTIEENKFMQGNSVVQEDFIRLHHDFARFRIERLIFLFQNLSHDYANTLEFMKREFPDYYEPSKEFRIQDLIPSSKKSSKNEWLYHNRVLDETKHFKQEDLDLYYKKSYNELVLEFRNHRTKLSEQLRIYNTYSKFIQGSQRNDQRKEFQYKRKTIELQINSLKKKSMAILFSQCRKQGFRKIDLHGLFEDEALELADVLISSISGRVNRGNLQYNKPQYFELEIITGKGRHSRGNPILFPALRKHLTEQGLNCKLSQDEGKIDVEII